MLKVGLIGCGFMGEMHANCYKNLQGVELTAVADLREDRLEKIANDTKAQKYKNGLELINNAQVDIIDICLPTFLHAEYALLAMDKVKYLFIEKPVAFTNKEGKKLLKKAKETGCNVQVGQVIRFWDEYVELKKILKTGECGKVVNADFYRISPVPTWGWKSWLLDSKLSGGAGQDLHIHDIDYVLSVFGKPNKFYTVKNIIDEKNSYVNTLMQYKDFVINVKGTWGLPESYPFNAGFRVRCENCVIEYKNGKLLKYSKNGVTEIKIEKKDLGAVSGGNISDLGGYYNELKYFTDCAKNNGKIVEATLKDACESLKFVLAEIK